MEVQVAPRWRKSTYSGNGGGDCVEAGVADVGSVLVRDTRDRGGRTIAFTADAWVSFTATLK
jgi:hypothetical protein